MFKYILFSLLLITGCSDDTYAIQTDDPYYLKLEKQCNGDHCCLASLQSMILKDLKAIKGTECPQGYHFNALLCGNSYHWCEKTKKDK
jgi:hypothetical protein